MSQVAYQHYIRALARWPKDNLRPDCQFQDAMRRRLDRRFLPPAAAATAAAAAAASSSTPEPAAAVAATTHAVAADPPLDVRSELEQVNAIYSLIDNRYTRKVGRRRPSPLPISRETRAEGERQKVHVADAMCNDNSIPSPAPS
jgi:hypothetical protein